jgi:hypothetical protein
MDAYVGLRDRWYSQSSANAVASAEEGWAGVAPVAERSGRSARSQAARSVMDRLV